jgi:hypothetical protein
MGQLHHLFSIGFAETSFVFFCKFGSHLGYATGRSEPDAFKTCSPCLAFRSTATLWICLKLAHSLRITYNIVTVPRLKHKQKIYWGITHFRHTHSYHSYRYLLVEMTIELILWVCGRNHYLRISLVSSLKIMLAIFAGPKPMDEQPLLCYKWTHHHDNAVMSCHVSFSNIPFTPHSEVSDLVHGTTNSNHHFHES